MIIWVMSTNTWSKRLREMSKLLLMESIGCKLYMYTLKSIQVEMFGATVSDETWTELLITDSAVLAIGFFYDFKIWKQ